MASGDVAIFRSGKTAHGKSGSCKGRTGTIWYFHSQRKKSIHFKQSASENQQKILGGKGFGDQQCYPNGKANVGNLI